MVFDDTPWFVPDSSKLDSAHLSYQQGLVVQFPRTTRSSEVVSKINFTWPLKSQVFSAFEPVEQIRKLCSPANKPGFCSEKVFLRKGIKPAPVPFPLFFGLSTNLNGESLKISIWQNDVIFSGRQLAYPRCRFLNFNSARKGILVKSRDFQPVHAQCLMAHRSKSIIWRLFNGFDPPT